MKRLLKAVAPTAVITLALAGCSAAGHPTVTVAPAAEHATVSPQATATATPSATPSATPAPSTTTFAPLTPDVATQAFQTFVANDDVARASDDERLALGWTSDGQISLTSAEFDRATAAGTPVARYLYTKTVFYVPRLGPKGAQWFVVSARRTTMDGKNGQNVMMGFVHAKPTAHWTLSVVSVLDKKAPPPQIFIDPEGYATPLATFDARLIVQPRLVASIQATLAEEGPSNLAAKYLQDGTHSSDYYKTDQATRKQLKPKGFGYDVTYQATGFPIFPLATANGGGFVLYTMNRNPVITKKSATGPGQIPIPAAARIFIDPATVKAELDISETQQYGAIVPPAHKGKGTPGKIQIIASNGAVVNAAIPTTP